MDTLFLLPLTMESLMDVAGHGASHGASLLEAPFSKGD
jgi:hypothetical protein